jgi:glycerol-3-phosphate acyltransferase PlsY
MPLWLVIVAIVAAYFVFAIPLGSWLGRRLRRQQPHNHNTPGGPR